MFLTLSGVLRRDELRVLVWIANKRQASRAKLDDRFLLTKQKKMSKILQNLMDEGLIKDASDEGHPETLFMATDEGKLLVKTIKAGVKMYKEFLRTLIASG